MKYKIEDTEDNACGDFLEHIHVFYFILKRWQDCDNYGWNAIERIKSELAKLVFALVMAK